MDPHDHVVALSVRAADIGNRRVVAIGEFDIASFPFPVGVGGLLAVSTTTPGEFGDHRFGQSLTSFAIGGRVRIGLGF